jgi:mono/diheme cytochrome c family protein
VKSAIAIPDTEIAEAWCFTLIHDNKGAVMNTKKLISAGSLIALIAAMLSCADHPNATTAIANQNSPVQNSAADGKTSTAEATPTPAPAVLHPEYANVSAEIFAPSCVRCHSEPKPKGGILLDNYENIKANLDDVASEIYSGDMPPRKVLSDAKIALLARWIYEGSPEVVGPNGAPTVTPTPSSSPTATPVQTATPTETATPVETVTPSPTANPPTGSLPEATPTVTPGTASMPVMNATPAPVLLPTYASIHEQLLKGSCLECHGIGQKLYAKYPLEPYASLMATMDVVKVGDADQSSFYTEMQNGDMPTDRSKLPKVTAEQLSVIKQWIQSGAPQ